MLHDDRNEQLRRRHHWGRAGASYGWLALAVMLVVSVGQPGCGASTPCEDGSINAFRGDPNNAACTRNCECNNQNYEGYCQKPAGAAADAKGICVAAAREECPKPGERRPCLFAAERRDPQFKCPWGAQICQPEGMQFQKWGDCAPFELTQEDGKAAPSSSTRLCSDGFDNDCDGRVDLTDPKCVGACKPGAVEPCYSASSGLYQGSCRPGTRTCSDEGTWGNCVGEVTPQPQEICNGIDDNCDGNIDEDLKDCASTTLCQPSETRPCYTQRQGCERVDGRFVCRGLCKAGVQTCKENGRWGACVGDVYPKDDNGVALFVEKCDEKEGTPAIDDNCDGVINEGCLCQQAGATRPCYSGNPGDIQQGGTVPCRVGVQRCVAGRWGACEGQVVPAIESCNGIDDDCDGTIDEDLPALPCENQKGVCRGTSRRCKAGHYPACTAADFKAVDTSYAPKEDPTIHCDGKDNNCDGKIDEGCACTTGQLVSCYQGKTGCTRKDKDSPFVCQGECRAGFQLCVNGQVDASCRLQVLPSPEVCDGKDNDCDGLTDEDCGDGPHTQERTPDGDGGTDGPSDAPPPDLSCQGTGVRSCNTGMKGLCQTGRQTCQGGQWGPCTPNVQPAPEVCDGKDNDCDGLTDEAQDLIGTFKTCTGPEQSYHKTHPQPYLVNPCLGALAGCFQGRPTDPARCTARDFQAYNNRYQPSPETRCDGIDNDCNGKIDENCPWSFGVEGVQGLGMKQDDKGNLFLFGAFGHTITIGTLSQTVPGAFCVSSFVVKLSPSGQALSLAVAHGVRIQDISIAPGGAVLYATGVNLPAGYNNCFKSGAMKFGNVTLTTADIGGIGGSGGGAHDAFVASLDVASGTWRWAFHYGSSTNDVATSIVSKASGGGHDLYIAGSFESTLAFAPAYLDIPAATRFSAQIAKLGPSKSEYYLMKIEDRPAKKPKFGWFLTSKGKMDFLPGALQLDASGDIVLTAGYGVRISQMNRLGSQAPALGSVSLPPINTTNLTNPKSADGSWDILIARVEDKGTQAQVKWARTLGCTHQCELSLYQSGTTYISGLRIAPAAGHLCLGPAGKIYVVGRFAGELPLPGGSKLTAAEQDGFIAQLSSTGVLSWVAKVTGQGANNSEESMDACVVSPSGKAVYATGRVWAMPEGPPAILGPKPIHQKLGFGSYDAFLVGYDTTNGSVLDDTPVLLGNRAFEVGTGLLWGKDLQGSRTLMWLLNGQLNYNTLQVKNGLGVIQFGACPASGPVPQGVFCYR